VQVWCSATTGGYATSTLTRFLKSHVGREPVRRMLGLLLQVLSTVSYNPLWGIVFPKKSHFTKKRHGGISTGKNRQSESGFISNRVPLIRQGHENTGTFPRGLNGNETLREFRLPLRASAKPAKFAEKRYRVERSLSEFDFRSRQAP